MNCSYCGALCHKKGKRNGRQVYRCTLCQKSQRKNYIRQRYCDGHRETIVALTLEGMGISSISRVLAIPKSSVCRLLLQASEKTRIPELKSTTEQFEIDELKTFIGNKENECWICYAIERSTRRVVYFIVGRRTKKNIKKVVQAILSLSPAKVYTDGLNVYPKLIPGQLHSTEKRQTNHIERFNLTLRTHLKRLSRKTICFSKSAKMLVACLKIYFWKGKFQYARPMFDLCRIN